MIITGHTRIAAVIGDPVEHSRSPAMLNAAFVHARVDAVMVPMHVHPPALAAALAGLRAMQALGASITMPHKLAAAAACDELAYDAQAIGAVNCVQVVGERLVGHNTDAVGFADGLAAAGFDPAGKRCVLVGAGGAARAVAYGLAGADVVVVAREPAKVAWCQAQRFGALGDLLASAALVVDCTPVGFDAEAAHGIPLDHLAADAVVATLVYHAKPRLLADAEARGNRILDGRAMLVHQAARAFAIWTNQPPPVDVMAAALARSLQH